MFPALLKWIGNKQRFAEEIVSYMPTNFHNYYEPFLGSGAVMIELLRHDSECFFPHFEHAYGSDVLPFLINIFNITKNSPQELIDYYESEITPYYNNPTTNYNIIRDRFNKDHNPYDFCLLSRTCYSGIIRFRQADGYMSTPKGPHNPIKPSTFAKRVNLWSPLIQKVDFVTETFLESMDKAVEGDLVYCDPPYTHSQNIIYGAQRFDISELWKKIEECKKRGVYVVLSINESRESQAKNISAIYPDHLFEREVLIDCGISMIDRLQNTGKRMENEKVHDKLLLTW